MDTSVLQSPLSVDSCSLGLGLRAVGHSWNVFIIQFMKGQISYGELNTIEKLDNFDIKQFGRPDFVEKENPDVVDIQEAEQGFEYARKIVTSGKYDLVILDEIVCAVDFGLLDLQAVLDLLASKPDHVELVLTGRGAPQELIAACDYVTEMKEVKHPFQNGVQAREGIEY